MDALWNDDFHHLAGVLSHTHHLEHLGGTVRGSSDGVGIRRRVPAPGVGEGRVVPVGVERWVGVDQVHRRIGDLGAQDVEVVAVEQPVGQRRYRPMTEPNCGQYTAAEARIT